MIITFQGVDSKVGTTMIAQSFAEYLAKEKPTEKVLLLLFADNRGRTYIKDKSFPYIEQLLPVLKEPFKPETIYDNSYVDKNLFIFGGISRRYKKREIEPQVAYNIIETVKKFFDHIIIDAGNTMDFGLSMPGVLAHSDKLCYVLAQNKTAIDEFIDIREYFGYFGVKPDYYIMNKVEGTDLFTVQLICNIAELTHSKLIQIPLMKKGRRTESEEATFFVMKDKEWIKEMKKLSKELLRRE